MAIIQALPPPPLSQPLVQPDSGIINPQWLYFLQNVQAIGVATQTLVAALGDWIDVPYDAANFSGDLGTWTVDAADQVIFAYYVIGTTMFLTLNIKQSSCTATNYLTLKIPGGYLATKGTKGWAYCVDQAVVGTQLGSWSTQPEALSDALIYLDINGSTIGPATDTIYVQAVMLFAVEPAP